MFTDILDGNNYLFVNKKLVKLLGLHPAVYCAELLRCLSVVKQAEGLFDKKYIPLNRDKMLEYTGISIAEQKLIDASLESLELIERHKTFPDCIAINDEKFEMFIAEADTLNQKEAKALKAHINRILQPKKVKQAGLVQSLQDAITIDNPILKEELDNWVASVCRNGRKLTAEAIQLFIKTILNYSKDIDTLVKVIQCARIHNYIDAEYAIDSVNRKEQISAENNKLLGNVVSKRGSIKDFEEGDKF